MANNLNYEPRPFTEMEKHLMEEIKTTNKMIIQN